MKTIHNKIRLLLFAAISCLIAYNPLTKGMFGVLERDIHQAFAKMQYAESAEQLKATSENTKQLIEKIKVPQIKEVYLNDFEQEYSKAITNLEKFKRAEFELQTIKKLQEKGIEPTAYADLLRMAKQKTLELSGRKQAVQNMLLNILQTENDIKVLQQKKVEQIQKIQEQIAAKTQGDANAQTVATIAKIVGGLLEKVYQTEFQQYLKSKDIIGSFKKYLNHLIELKVKNPQNIWDIYEQIIPTQEQLKEILQ